MGVILYAGLSCVWVNMVYVVTSGGELVEKLAVVNDGRDFCLLLPTCV
jgi:hypothetical protein